MDPSRLHHTAQRIAGPDERVLWVGEPRQGLFLRRSDLFVVPFSLVWLGFAVFWTTTARSAGAAGFFTLWGCMFIAFGCYLVVGRFVADAWSRRHTTYVLTDRRLIRSSTRRMQPEVSTPLSQLGSLELVEHSAGRGTIRYGVAENQQPLAGAVAPDGWPGTSRYRRPKLDSITDARLVYDQLLAAAHAAGAPPVA